jgi:2-phosphoglycerate kinase
MHNDKKTLIIVLSGTYGVGKTTLAHQLSIDLQIMQRIGLSSIAKTIKTVLPDDPMLKNWYVRDKIDPKFIKTKLKKEAKLIGKVVKNIVSSTYRTGENYIIDGVQLLPEFLPMDKILFFRVYVSDKKKYKKMLHKPTITRLRRMTDISYELAKKVENLIEEECNGHPIYNIDNIRTPKQASKKIINIIKKNHPNYKNEYLWFGKN